jgi:hypothetical protein
MSTRSGPGVTARANWLHAVGSGRFPGGCYSICKAANASPFAALDECPVRVYAPLKIHAVSHDAGKAATAVA